MKHIWTFQEYDEDLAEVLSQQLKISKNLSRLLVQRRITAIQQAQEFLNPSLERLTDPFCLQGMQPAVARIREAVDSGQKLVIYGDYDVDGICSVVILKECLEYLGAKVDYHIPNRFAEGYGLNGEAIQMLAGEGCHLLITVDCGISAYEEVSQAEKLGMDLIITDHHTPPAVQPPALAIINPRNDSLEDVQFLCGAGVAFKLACALLEDRPRDPGLWLDLVAMATIADVVPLLGENRILVKHGLYALERTKRPGLRALIDQNGLGEKTLSSWHIGYVLAPRLNSAGRIESADISVDLLTTSQLTTANLLATRLNELNEQRRQIEEVIYQEALEQIKTCTYLPGDPILILAGEGWHQGVIGIVASRLAEQFERPCIIISWDGETGRGSARSREGFDLYQALSNCADCLIEYGGHKMAAGLGLKRDQLNIFRERISSYAATMMPPGENFSHHQVDLEVQEHDITQTLYDDIQRLTPFGEGNPMPRLLLTAGELSSPKWVGVQKSHLKFRTRAGNFDAIAFNRSDLNEYPLIECNQDLMFELETNEFAGRQNLQLKIREVKSTYRGYNEFMAGQQSEWLQKAIEKIVDEIKRRRPVVIIYPTFRSLSKNQAYIEYYLNRSSLQYLHGLSPMSERKLGSDKFRAGKGLVFITTRAYWEFYKSSDVLPLNLGHVLELWPIPGSSGQADLPEHIKIDSWPGVDVRGLGRYTELAENEGKSLIYVNQIRTLRNLEKYFPQADSDTGLADIKVKRAIRQNFSYKTNGILFSDGSLIPGFSFDEKLQNLYLADSPFGSYELAAFADYLLRPEPVSLKIIFDRDSIERNHVYLDKMYPLPGRIKDIMGFCRLKVAYLQRNSSADPSDLISKLSEGRFSRLEVASALRILADIGLCEPQKSGSIIATNAELAQNLIPLVTAHPYCLEGEAEKRALADWEAQLDNL